MEHQNASADGEYSWLQLLRNDIEWLILHTPKSVQLPPASEGSAWEEYVTTIAPGGWKGLIDRAAQIAK